MSAPRITVITVCFNSVATIADTLSAVAMQRNSDYEHVVVDGASADGTVELVRNFSPKVARLISEPDRGLYDAMNKGIAAATGNYIGFLNSDDVYANPDVLAKVAKALESGPVDAVHGDLLYVSAADTGKVIRYWKSKPYHPGAFEAGWHPAHPTLFVRTELLRGLGGFDTSYRYHADFDLMVRLFIERRISSAYIPEVLVRMRTGGQSNRSIGNIVRGNRESYQIARRTGIAVSPLWFARKLCNRIPQFIRRPPAP
ncbi:MAG TPA: glycosyltransferase family 2 protein [Burkholderiales bacterium]